MSTREKVAKVASRELNEKVAKVALQELALHCGMELSLCCKDAIAPVADFSQTKDMWPLAPNEYLHTPPSHLVEVARKEPRGRQIC